MKVLNLDKTWELCMAMWDYIVQEITQGKGKDPASLKAHWCYEHKWEDIHEDCFFCEYKEKKKSGADFHTNLCAKHCPGALVDPEFQCELDKYNWYESPLDFHKELQRLNKIRLKEQKK